MKVEINIVASISDEAGYDSNLVATEVVARNLKNNGVIEVHEIAVRDVDAV